MSNGYEITENTFFDFQRLFRVSRVQRGSFRQMSEGIVYLGLSDIVWLDTVLRDKH